MSKEQIKAIGDWAVKHDIMIISDELYAHLTYGGKKHTMFTAFPEFKDRTVVLNGFSKAYAMTGLRKGFNKGRDHFVDIEAHGSHSTFHINIETINKSNLTHLYIAGKFNC